MEDALEMWRALGDVREIAPALEGLGWAEFLADEEQKARVTFEESLRLHRASGDPHMVNRAMVALAQVLVALDRVDEACAMSLDIIAFSQTHGDLRSEHSGWHYLADCALIEGKCAESLGLYRKSLALAQEIGDLIEIGFEVQGVAMSLAGLGEAERALRLAGSVEADWQRLGASARVRFWDALLDRYLGPARRGLGHAAADRAWTEGRAIPLDVAAGDALRVD
jgi:tetratricopeptide (TPR) repeat protein